jgi:DNA-directed RNA polymerases I, II, and III subunit RPABC5
MIIPVRCFSCGKVIGGLWNKYQDLIINGSTPCEALDELKLVRICCRRMLFTHVNLIDELLQYEDKFSSVPVVEETPVKKEKKSSVKKVV